MRFLLMLSALAVAFTQARAATPPMPTAVEASTVTAQADRSPTAQAQPAAETAPMRTFALGIGYPDLRARWGFSDSLAAELKFSLASSAQVYSARAYYAPWSLGQLKLQGGVELGLLQFQGISGLSGSGMVGGVFAGGEYAFGRRARLNLDAGPYFLQASALGSSASASDVVISTALYFYLF